MPYEAGQSGNIAGRPRLTDKQKEERTQFQALLKEATVPALKSIIEIASDKRNKDRLSAAKYIIDKAYGNTAFLLDNEIEPINVRIIRCSSTEPRERSKDDWD